MNFLMAGTYLDNVAIDRSLSITGAGAKKTTVDGGKAGTVFTINNPAVVTLSGMTQERAIYPGVRQPCQGGVGAGAGPSEEEKTSEQSACETCRESVESSAGLVIADFSPRNFERLESFQEIAKKTGRKLVATAKDIYMLHNLQCISGSCMTDGLRIYDEIMDKALESLPDLAIHPTAF